jgi:type VI secretion system secreted protein VgrG
VRLAYPALPARPDGEPLLLLSSISGGEDLSRIFRYVLNVRTSPDANLTADESANLNLLGLIGQEVTVTIQLVGMGAFVAGAAGRSGSSNVGQGTREISSLISDGDANQMS